MKKTLTTALLISALSFSTAPAFAANPDPSKFPSNCQTLSPGVTECNDVLDKLTNGVTVATTDAYPAPAVTPNTTNGTPAPSTQPTPAPATPAPEASTELAATGITGWMLLWAVLGAFALGFGITTVVMVRRNA